MFGEERLCVYEMLLLARAYVSVWSGAISCTLMSTKAHDPIARLSNPESWFTQRKPVEAASSLSSLQKNIQSLVAHEPNTFIQMSDCPASAYPH